MCLLNQSSDLRFVEKLVLNPMLSNKGKMAHKNFFF